MSTTVERVTEFCKTHHDNVLVGVNHRRWMLIEEELLSFLDSLAAERCVWTPEVKREDGSWILARTSCQVPFFETVWFSKHYSVCPYCGKRIEVKEADNEHD